MNLRRAAAALVSILVFSASPLSQAQAAADDYKLGPEDKVRITVYEWRSARNEAYEWSALKGEFTVGPSGTISLPLIGEMEAASLSTGELAGLISDRLQSKVGLAQHPDAAVEVVRFRPFYVLGHVNKPGEYSYRPGLTALQAVSMAGASIVPTTRVCCGCSERR